MTGRLTPMPVFTRYLPLSQQQDEPALPHNATPSGWWALRKSHAVCFIAENAGLLLVICAASIFASMDLSVKLLETLDLPTPTLEVRKPANVITLR